MDIFNQSFTLESTQTDHRGNNVYTFFIYLGEVYQYVFGFSAYDGYTFQS